MSASSRVSVRYRCIVDVGTETAIEEAEMDFLMPPVPKDTLDTLEGRVGCWDATWNSGSGVL